MKHDRVQESVSADGRPVVIVSRCLGFDACRWNGAMVRDPFVESLRKCVECVDVCPEMEIGLGVPRDPVRIIGSGDGGTRLVQPATGHDLTEAMVRWAGGFCDDLSAVDGFLLKYRSPSCGPSDVKVYADASGHAILGKKAGMFAALVQQRYPELAVEDEGRLHHFRLREHWLIRIFAGYRLRRACASGQMRDLVDFHSRHKYLLLAYDQEGMRGLGHIVAAGSRKTAVETSDAYGAAFHQCLARPAALPAVVNVLQHIMGHFSRCVEARERRYFLNVLEEYRRGGLPLSVPIELLKSWAIRFENDYILRQAFLHPYPEALAMISDSGRGREL